MSWPEWHLPPMVNFGAARRERVPSMRELTRNSHAFLAKFRRAIRSVAREERAELGYCDLGGEG